MKGTLLREMRDCNKAIKNIFFIFIFMLIFLRHIRNRKIKRVFRQFELFSPFFREMKKVLASFNYGRFFAMERKKLFITMETYKQTFSLIQVVLYNDSIRRAKKRENECKIQKFFLHNNNIAGESERIYSFNVLKIFLLLFTSKNSEKLNILLNYFRHYARTDEQTFITFYGFRF